MLFHKDHAVPKGLQKILIAAVGGAFVVQAWHALALMFEQSFVTQEFDAFVAVAAWQAAVPALLFGVAYYMNPRKGEPTAKFFESILITIAGVAVFTGMNELVTFFGNNVLFVTSEHYAAYQLVMATILVTVYTAVLWQLRSTKKWK